MRSAVSARLPRETVGSEDAKTILDAGNCCRKARKGELRLLPRSKTGTCDAVKELHWFEFKLYVIYVEVAVVFFLIGPGSSLN